jgi:hypothetical protein
MRIGLVVVALSLVGCAHGHHPHGGGRAACGGDSSEDEDREGGLLSARRSTKGWTTVRIDEPDGARVTMERGPFSDALDVKAPFQATFQATARNASAGYPFEIELDATTAARYGASAAVKLKGQLTVPESARRRGVLRIAPSDCSMRALLAGDLDVLRVTSEELPTAEVVCAGTAALAAQPVHQCPMGPGDHGGGCDHKARAHGCGAAKRTCGAGHGGCDHHGSTAVLTLRVTKR